MVKFPIIKVPLDAADSSEQMGTKRKFWYHDGQSGLTLFKEGRPGTGENWAEKVAAELADLLGVPHAIYDLATWGDDQGVVCPTFVPDQARLVHGNEILARGVRDYDPQLAYGQVQHTVRHVLTVMRATGHAPPHQAGQREIHSIRRSRYSLDTSRSMHGLETPIGITRTGVSLIVLMVLFDLRLRLTMPHV